MATTKQLTKTLTENKTEIVAGLSLNALLQTDTMKKKFHDVLGKKAAGFMSSILSAASTNPMLKNADPMTVISAAMVAATLDLPINQSLGFAHIVPYSGKAQFQIGWKGLIQLAMRSGQYLTINLAVVHEGELVKHDPFTGQMQFDANGKKSDNAIGYVLYFKLLNGYEKYFYMTKEQATAHGRRYSKSFDTGNWKNNFEAMALKTVAKLGLSKYGILSIEMQKAVELDQAVVGEDEKPEYIDAAAEPVADAPVIDEGIPFGPGLPEAK